MFMKEYVLSIIVSILLVSIASIILPDGKMAKFTKSIFSIIIIIIIITPAINLLKNESFNGFEFESDFAFSEDEDYLDYVYYKRVENLSATTESLLKSDNYETDVEIIYDISNYQIVIKKINVNFNFDGISEDDKHIIISVIKQTVSEYLNVDKEIVIVK